MDILITDRDINTLFHFISSDHHFAHRDRNRATESIRILAPIVNLPIETSAYIFLGERGQPIRDGRGRLAENKPILILS